MEDKKNKSITGYIHNLSPIKKSQKTSYFDMQIQTHDSILRGVCFSPPKLDKFKDICETKSPVKLTNVNIKVSDDTQSVLMDNRTNIEQVEPEFQIQVLEPIQNIASLAAVNNRQLVTLKAEITQLSGIKRISTQYGIKRKLEGILSDAHSSIRIILWEDFTEQVKDGDTYNFKNLRVRKEPNSNELYVNTPPSGCTIEACDAFKEPTAQPLQLPDVFTNVTCPALILGINNFTTYFSCSGCKKKLPSEAVTIVKCISCGMKQNISNCTTHFFLQCLMKTDTDRVTVTLFDDAIKQMPCFAEKSTDQTLSEEEVTDALLSLQSVTITYNKKTKLVSSLQPV